MNSKKLEAFVIGVALGDGNLSNPNGRAIRLRITCDTRYPNLIKEVTSSLQTLFPNNQVSLVKRKDSCVDVSLYSNKLEGLLPWQAGQGTKYDQQAHVPDWIFEDTSFAKACLRGLILTDGSIYNDRGYTMVNVCSNIQLLAENTMKLGELLGFKATISSTPQKSGKPKYTVRFARDAEKLLKVLKLDRKL